MKGRCKLKIGMLVVAILTALVLSLPTLAMASMGDTVLKTGSTGSDVVELQTKLNEVGFNSGEVDGIFGGMTKQSVMSFQLSHHLRVDGYVGSLTANSLNEAYRAEQRQKKIDSVVATSKQYIGVPYLWGGTTPKGFDCSGLTQYVFAKNYITLPRVSGDQYKVGSDVSFENLKAGDLVFFSISGNGVVSHVGIYLGDGLFINASSSKGVTVYTLGSYWKSVYVGAKRVI